MNSWKEQYLQKVIAPEDVAKLCAKVRFEGKRIVTTNGSFDLLHAGHLHQIYEASQLGDLLIVCLNSDDSIKKYKSEDRPIIPLEYRLQMLAALEFVDYVTYFSETDPRRILEEIRPSVHVNGAEYGSECIEADTVKKGGGEIHLVSKIGGLSTSNIIEKIVKIHEAVPQQ